MTQDKKTYVSATGRLITHMPELQELPRDLKFTSERSCSEPTRFALEMSQRFADQVSNGTKMRLALAMTQALYADNAVATPKISMRSEKNKPWYGEFDKQNKMKGRRVR